MQQQYSHDGLEVRARGPRSFSIEMPPAFHDVGSLCADLERGFGAAIDVTASATVGTGPTLTVWPATIQPDTAAAADPTLSAVDPEPDAPPTQADVAAPPPPVGGTPAAKSTSPGMLAVVALVTGVAAYLVQAELG